jgi:hypothetical protein
MSLLVLFFAALLGSFLTASSTTVIEAPGTDRKQARDDAACPAYLPALPDFEFPHEIIPVSSSNPTVAYANTFIPYVTAGDFSSRFNFDIPPERSGQMCTIQFLFPEQNQLHTSFFQLDGFGTYSFSLSPLGTGAVAGNTTFDHQPLPSYVHGFPRSISMQPGNAYTIGATICVPGEIAVTMSSTDSSLTWFQDYGLCAIGLYITYSP